MTVAPEREPHERPRASGGVDVRAAVRACFEAYEAALVAGDVAAMNGWFAAGPDTSRFGVAEEHRGSAAIAQWRSTAPAVPAGRSLSGTEILVLCDEAAVVTTLFHYPGSEEIGRQSQTWRRTAAGWRIVHAHVSQRPAR